MAVDSTNLRDVTRERATPLPTGEIVATDGTIKQLQIPDEVALRPENVIPFLAGQSVRLKEITERPEIKTLEADIPEYLYDERAHVPMALSREEQTALTEWHQDMRSMLSTASEGSDSMDQIKNDIQNYIDNAMKDNPDLFKGGSGTDTSDVLDQWFTGQMVAETEETKKKYQQLMVAARGDPESILLAMTYRHAQSSMLKMGKLLEMYKTHMDGLDKIQADLDLKNAKGDLTQADMMKTNMDFARSQGDAMNLFQIIQKEMGNYERTMQSASSLSKSINDPLRSIIGNMRGS